VIRNKALALCDTPPLPDWPHRMVKNGDVLKEENPMHAGKSERYSGLRRGEPDMATSSEMDKQGQKSGGHNVIFFSPEQPATGN